MKLLYFSWIRTTVGHDSEDLALPASIRSVSELLDWLETRGEAWQNVFCQRSRIRVAVNQAFAKPETPLKDGDEVALFPPVTGG